MEDNYVSIEAPPPWVGSMEMLPGVAFRTPNKPAWFHRIMLRLLLGWKWTDRAGPDPAPPAADP